MTAKPDVVGEIKPGSSTFEAAVVLLEDQERIIRGLRKQNERLSEEKLQVELTASLEVAKTKLGQAQAFQRMNAIENDLNNLRNWITGNLVQRDEFADLKRQFNDLSYRVPV